MPVEYQHEAAFEDLEPLNAVVEKFISRYRTQNFEEAAQLFEQHVLEIWFALPFDWLRHVLADLITANPKSNGAIRLLYDFLTPTSRSHFGDHAYLQNTSRENIRLAHLLKLLDRRLNGDLKGADTLAREIRERTKTHHGFDRNQGWGLMLNVQAGITAMLAGDVSQALTDFAIAQAHPLVPTLPFLTRGAYLYSALLHATFGDKTEADHLLIRAQPVAKTTAWIESYLDAAEELTLVMLGKYPDEQLLERIESLSLRNMGEMWPFYVQAISSAMERASHDDIEVLRRLRAAVAGATQWSEGGDGYVGSIYPLTNCACAIRHSDYRRGVKALKKADQQLPVVILMSALLELCQGNTKRAKDLAYRLREPVDGLRKQQLWRFAIIAAAHFYAEEFTECVLALENVMELPRGISDEEQVFFPPEIRAFAREARIGWPAEPEKLPASVFTGISPTPHILSDREQQVIELLGQGFTRKRIAAQLFITENTLKTHLRSMYKKLDVETREGAILKAERLRLL